MLSGLIRLVLKIKWWKNFSMKRVCGGFCPTCHYFDVCQNEVYTRD